VLHVLQAENRTPGFHVQPDSDEMFCVMEGRFRIDLEDSLADHSKSDFLFIPRGTRHRPVCTSLVKCLRIERAGTLTKTTPAGRAAIAPGPARGLRGGGFPRRLSPGKRKSQSERIGFCFGSGRPGGGFPRPQIST